MLPGCAGSDVGGNNGGNNGFDSVGDDDGSGNQGDDDNQDTTSLTGVVRGWQLVDVAGEETNLQMPVEGVEVSTNRGESTTTDSDGRFLLADVEPGERVLVSFSKSGYAWTQTPLDILEGVENTIIQTIAVVDFTSTFEAGTGTSFELEEGLTVDLPASNFLDASGTAYDGQVTVEATFFDIDTVDVDGYPSNGNELFATPGDFSAVDSDEAEVILESFGMFQINLWDENGEELNLGATGSSIVMPIESLGSTPELGDVVEAWSYNTENGKWVEEGTGTVIDLGDGVLAWEFTAPHFSTWNCDRPMPTHGCLSGVVTDSQGNARSGATVRAVGISYISTTTARTGQDGSFCLEVKNGETVWGEISYTVGGQPASQRTDPVTIPSGQATCQDGDSSDCYDLGVIPVEIMACVQGLVLDAQGNAVSDAQVISPQGGLATSATDGSFCLSTPVFQTTEVYVLSVDNTTVGYQPQVLYTQPGRPDCSAGCSNIVRMRPYTSTSCAQGSVVINNETTAGIVVEAYDDNFDSVRIFSALTDAAGQYCVPVPAGIEASVQVGVGDTSCGSQSVTGAVAGAECDESNQGGECLQVGSIDCNF